ncbi:hypothetical protein [uncultured Sneathia sp.]|uniref:hypothetical protein n=1 Tax=uncultured Sneathia sp. TaxID=278067 RepID=UPI002597D006|nr:hypothetical protein [uncultured Sneathia sp.]
MKKIFCLFFMMSVALLAADNRIKINEDKNPNVAESKFNINTKNDNILLEAVYKKELEEGVSDLKSYFKNGNSIGLNITYFWGEGNNKQNTQDRISIINFSNKPISRKSNINYELKSSSEQIKRTVNAINETINIGNVKVKAGNSDKNKTKSNTVIPILNSYGVMLQKKYGKLDKNKLLVQENSVKTYKIVITFNGGK